MAESGDWITPRLYGKPWFEKPPLYYWGAAASFKLFGVSETTARLPSALCALFVTLALAWLAWRVYGAQTARWFLILLPSTVGMIGFSHAAATDMPFSAMLLIAMVSAAVAMGLARGEKGAIIPRTPWLALILFGFFLGLAMLAKGPAAIILSGGAVFFWAVCTRRWRDAFRLLHPVAIASFLATSLPWYILCAHRNSDFFRVFIIEHNFKRFLTPEFQHIQPFWYYGPILLLAFLPWTPIFLWSITSSLSGARQLVSRDPLGLVFLLFSGFCVLFFSISQSKLPGYILPAIPCLVLSMAETTSRAARQKSRAFASFLLGSGGLLAVASVVLARMPARQKGLHPDDQALAAFALFAIAAALLLAGACLFSQRRSPSARRAQAFVATFMCLLVFAAGALLSEFIDPRVSERRFSSAIGQKEIPSGQIATFRLNRARLYQLNFYLRRELPEWDPLREPPPRYLLTSANGQKALREAGIETLPGCIYDGSKDFISVCEVRR